jgi:hypothetical protein
MARHMSPAQMAQVAGLSHVSVDHYLNARMGETGVANLLQLVGVWQAKTSDDVWLRFWRRAWNAGCKASSAVLSKRRRDEAETELIVAFGRFFNWMRETDNAPSLGVRAAFTASQIERARKSDRVESVPAANAGALSLVSELVPVEFDPFAFEHCIMGFEDETQACEQLLRRFQEAIGLNHGDLENLKIFSLRLNLMAGDAEFQQTLQARWKGVSGFQDESLVETMLHRLRVFSVLSLVKGGARWRGLFKAGQSEDKILQVFDEVFRDGKVELAKQRFPGVDEQALKVFRKARFSHFLSADHDCPACFLGFDPDSED